LLLTNQNKFGNELFSEILSKAKMVSKTHKTTRQNEIAKGIIVLYQFFIYKAWQRFILERIALIFCKLFLKANSIPSQKC